MTEAVYLTKAVYRGRFVVYVEFNTGEAGEIDLEDIVFKYKQSQPLRNTEEFSDFYLDSWPTIAWKCGFDIAPESLYRRLLDSQPDRVENA